MTSLDFHGTISIKDDMSSKGEAHKDAFAAYYRSYTAAEYRSYTAADPWLTICHDGSYLAGGHGGASAICNSNWLGRQGDPIARRDPGCNREVLIEQSVGFSKVCNSIMAEEVACSLACNMARSELRRHESQLKPGTTVHIVLIGDCVPMWRHIEDRNYIRRPDSHPSFVRDFIVYQSHTIHSYAKSIGIRVNLQGLWCGREAYKTVRYLGFADENASLSAKLGRALCSETGNNEDTQVPTWLDVLDPRCKLQMRIITRGKTTTKRLRRLETDGEDDGEDMSNSRKAKATSQSQDGAHNPALVRDHGNSLTKPQIRSQTTGATALSAPPACVPVPGAFQPFQTQRQASLAQDNAESEDSCEKRKTECADASTMTGGQMLRRWCKSHRKFDSLVSAAKPDSISKLTAPSASPLDTSTSLLLPALGHIILPDPPKGPKNSATSVYKDVRIDTMQGPRHFGLPLRHSRSDLISEDINALAVRQVLLTGQRRVGQHA